jgi:ADP-heptose:LPS heptosyltransferase
VQAPRHIAVIRFSAMGDVAMAVPVIKGLLQQYPNIHISFVSNAFFAPLFKDIDRCDFFPVFTKSSHKGLAGIWKLYRELTLHQHFDAVADIHNVLRSQILRKFFWLTGIPIAVINKGRHEKKQLTARKNKQFKQLPTTHERYAALFASLGLPLNLSNNYLIAGKEQIPGKVAPLIQPHKMLVGIAAFAMHTEKMYPLEKMKLLLAQLSKRQDIQLLFFGAPGKEAALLEEWQTEYAGSFNVAGKISFG